MDLSIVLNQSSAKYSDRSSGERRDGLFSFEVSGSRKLAPKWTLLGSGQVVKNTSNFPESFAYDRFALSAGVSYAL